MTVNRQKIKEKKYKKGNNKIEKKAFIEKVASGRRPAFIDPEKELLPTSKAMRLAQVARALDKGISEIANYLLENGFKIDSNPNAKLTIEQIEFINASRAEKNIENACVIDYTWKLLHDLRIDYSLIFRITPAQFEDLVAEFLDQSGFTVRLNGKTNRKDGGIDLIAWKKEIVTIIIAIQVKFKNDINKKVTSSEVRNFKGALAINDYFSAGMVVTNTDFTIDARWIEEQINSKLELKNYDDIKRWLNENFISKKDVKLDLSLGKDIKFIGSS